MADVTKEIALEVSLKDSTSAGTQSAKQRLREMQKELIAMAEAGQQGTDAFKRLEQQAGELKDEIADVNQRVKNLASDTKRIDAFVGAVQGIAAGFQIAQGAAALFGDENEDLQKAMLKVQGAMALANGVQQVANLLQKESAVMMGINTAATKLYAVAVGTATGAMRAFRIALAATGIGAIVVVLGLAAEAMGLFSTKTEDAADSQKDLKRIIDTDAKQRADKEKADRDRRNAQNKAQADREKQELKQNTDARLAEQERIKLIEIEGYYERLAAQKQFIAEYEAAIIAGMQKEAALRMSSTSAAIARDKATKDGELQRESDLRQAQQQMADQSFSIIGDIITATAGQSEEAQRKAFDVAKASNIAQAIVNTYLGVTQALAMTKVVFPGQQFVQAGLTLAAGLANVAKIRATQFQGGGGGGTAPSGNIVPSGGSQAPAPAVFSNPNVTDLSGFGGGQGQGMQPMRAYVVERDIQQTTSRVRRLSEFATLG
ncbi:MAG: hypothetical protein EB116_13515 [Betaproteobacteria bacterium]|nr:hypothetical protein [Betaproteobacteria bacterium]